MNPRLTNKRLVKRLMDTRGIEMISITPTNVVVQVKSSFTPAMGRDLIADIGHESDAKMTTRDGSNYIILLRN